MLTVSEALERLKATGITDSIQVLRKWIRDGEITAIPPEQGRRKEGYRIEAEELERFISQRNPLYPEVQRLRQENDQLKAELEQLKQQISNQKDRSEDEPKEDESEPIGPAQGADRNGELTWNQVCDIYEKETKRIKDSDILGGIWEEVMGLLFPMSLFPEETESTELRQRSGQFMCPATGKVFPTCEEAVISLIQFVIKKYQKKNATKGA
ncbi:helix-turn-helix domain-containing protein [Thermoactinomyces daqus]|uniref:Helix-turn-helix domain-containing protein n=1 Tax=Thermoactinomyces daqus TaxID=1329516 RepID=A0A7W1XDM5_9BACL|nr:helix-turn-helix domain-containing protein [Thermoactinomyces daqus]MBA4544613.1 helix-turn-helix domain-containing protein [Thermoactinomyces daqus]